MKKSKKRRNAPSTPLAAFHKGSRDAEIQAFTPPVPPHNPFFSNFRQNKNTKQKKHLKEGVSSESPGRFRLTRLSSFFHPENHTVLL